MDITRKQVRALEYVTEFTVTEAHLKLMRRMYVGWQWCETGAPEIDPKRPYGNSSVDLDVADILGWRVPDEDDPKYEQALEALGTRAGAVHAETFVALQIALYTGEFKAGTYRRSSEYDSRGWQRVPQS